MTITPLFVASAEWGTMAEWIEATALTGRVGVDDTESHTGAYAYELNTATNAYAYRNIPATRQLRTAFWAYPGTKSTVSVDVAYVSFWTAGAGAELIALKSIPNADAVGLYIGGTLIDSANYDLSTWVHWGLDFKIDAAAGWATVYANGEAVITYTGNTGNADAARVRLGAYGTLRVFTAVAPTYVDDLYVDDSTGEGAPGSLADRRFLLSRPNADAGPNDWTPSTGTDHYAVIDDAPANTSTYLAAASASLEERFTIPAPTIPAGLGVSRLWLQAIAQRTDAETASQYKLLADVEESAVITPPASFYMDMAAFDQTDTGVEFGIVSAGSF